MTFAWYKLDELPGHCIAALEEAEAMNPELGLDWFRNLARHALDPGMQAVVSVVQTEDGSGLALPVQYEQHRGRLSALANFYTSLYAPATHGPNVHACMRTLATGLRKEGWWCLRLAPMDADSVAFQSLLGALRSEGWWVFPYFCFGNWYLKTDDLDYAGYFRSRSSRVRNTVTRRERRLLVDERGRVEIIRNGAGLEAAIAAWTRIYNASWKVPEPYLEFMPALIRLCADKGWLRFGLAYYDGEPVAAQIWLVNGRRAAIYKLAYDERYTSLSAGTVLTARLMRHVLDEDKVEEVDYLIGDEDYKRDWMSHRRERWGIVAYNPGTLRGLMAGLRESAVRAVKRVLPWRRVNWFRSG